MLGDEKVRDRVKRLTIGNRVESDHQPIKVWIKGEEQRNKGIRERKGGRGEREIWTEEGRKEFRKELEKIRFGEKGLNGGGEEIKRRINKAIMEVGKRLKTKEAEKKRMVGRGM